MAQGRSNLSIRKSTVKTTATGTIAKDLFFSHKAAAGETIIDFTALSPAPEAAPLGNSTATELQAAKLWVNPQNLELKSSHKGALQHGLDWVMLSNSRIQLKFNTVEDEIFEGKARAVTGTAQGLDGENFVLTGTLTAGSTDIVLGRSFKTGENPGQQQGQLVVEMEGFETSLFRTVNNDASSEGNYWEVDAGGVYSILRVTDAPFAEDRDYKVYSAGPIISLPQTGQQQQIDKLNATVDKLVQTVAQDVGVSEASLQAQPSAPDLTQFGDRVTTLEKILNLEVSQAELQTLYYSEGGSALANRNLEVQFSGNLDDTDFVGDSLLTIVHDGANTRTEFVALKKCVVSVTLNSLSDTTDRLGIRKYSAADALVEQQVGTENSAGNFLGAAVTMDLEVGEYFTVGPINGNVPNTATDIAITVVAKNAEKKKISELI